MSERSFLNELIGQQWISNYMGVWAMEEIRFSALLEQVQSTELQSHIIGARGNADAADFSYPMLGENIALVDVQGTMTKRGSSFGGGGTVAMREQLRRATRDPVVEGIMLRIESPGGAVSGTAELAQAIADASAVKPVHAYIEDLGASAAYWAASQTQFVSANKMASVGSIGTYMVVADYTRAYENAGIKVHVISTGPFKGAGVPGSQLTEEQLAYFREEVAKINEHFLDAVKKGRRMTRAQVDSLATGRTWLASEAQANGLIDSVESFDAAVQRLSQAIKASKKGKKMSETTTAPSAATVQEIEAACPGATGEFVVSQLKAGATVAQASQAWAAEMARRLAESQTRLAAAEQRAQEAERTAHTASRVPGNEPVTNTGSQVSNTPRNALEEFHARIAEKMSLGFPRDQAAALVNRECPDLVQRVQDETKLRPRSRTVSA